MAPSKRTEEVESRKRKRDSLIQQITTINNALNLEALRELDEAAVEVRIEQVDRLEKRFDGIQTQLEDEEEPEDVVALFSSHYIEAKTKLTRQLYHCRGAESNRSIVRPASDEQPSIIVAPPKQRLPVLHIPKFSGNYTEWPDFFSMFNTVVHQDVDLTRIEKFQHLRSSLRDAALDTIRSLEISDQNYDKAIDLLKSRFDNKRLNFQAHIRDIVQLKRVEGDSVAKLRELSDNVNAHLRALQTMGTKEQIADCMLIQLVSQKLDVASRTKWEEEAPVNEIPTWSLMSKFLENRCQRLENVENAIKPRLPVKQVGNKSFLNNNRKVSLATSSNGCLLCNSSQHAVAQCETFTSLSPSMRYKEAKKLQLCLNCLKAGHSLRNCRSGCCKHCSLKHHTLLHQGTLPSGSAIQTPTSTSASAIVTDAPTSLLAAGSLSTSLSASASPFAFPAATLVSSGSQTIDFVLLATAVIYIKNRAGSLIPCRALLDSASQLNFITNRLVNQLQLRKFKSSLSISGIGQNGFVADHIVDLELHSRISDYSAKLSAVVTYTITDVQPSRSLKGIDWSIPSNIRLADPLFF
ncbi:PREDICTED: uncharacterized protein LOC108362964 [Rhagoletis zephyria]|uniref:uncharacterized protein LOC108362964 n=1 Tax=Rhagoletis zephyria TaxID=28612 RepID=UPI0008112E7B|nr:PREDICTED: uncharacterized protein LOC108362964 [Rhagoletis zephyria]